jgi:hypothetical protein
MAASYRGLYIPRPLDVLPARDPIMLNQLNVTPAGGYPAVFAPQHLAWVLQGLQCVDGSKPDGEGSERLPYRMSSIEQWAGAAAIELPPFSKGGMSAQEVIALSKKIGNDRGLYMIGGRLLERTPSGAYANYITDVVDGGKGVGKLKLGTSSLDRPRGFEAPSRDDKTPVYDTKFKRLNDGATASGKPLNDAGNNADMARQARALLKGEQTMSIAASDELPGTLGALFLAEVSREKRMLPLTLMLLDLIEAKKPGFSWSSLMTDNGETITGGVRHPMVHFGAQSQAENMFKSFNDVTQRAVAILAAWLAANPCKVGGWTVATDSVDTKNGLPKQIEQVDKAIGQKPPSETSKTGVLWRFHTDYILPAVQRRAATLDFMLA